MSFPTHVKFLQQLFLVAFAVFAGFSTAVAQTRWVTVLDSATQEPLPFAHLVFNRGAQGVITDMMGRTTIKIPCPETVQVGYVGYGTRTFDEGSIAAIDTVLLSKSDHWLPTVVVSAGPDPAFALMRKVYAARSRNDPEQADAFSFEAYDKFIFSAVPDSNKRNRNGQAQRISAMMQRHGLMIVENVTHRSFNKGQWTDTVLASRISGLRNTELPVLASQLQSFSFYQPTFTVANEVFDTPLMPRAERQFKFAMVDTLTDGADTTYVVAFARWNGSGLSGTLHIDAADLAIRSVWAAVNTAIGPVRIKQRSQKFGAGPWWPIEQGTEGTFTLFSTAGMFIHLNGTAYNLNFQRIEADQQRSPGLAELVVDKQALKRDSAYWNAHRAQSLSAYDRATYHTIDSLGKQAKLDRKVKLLTAAATGFLPIGPIDLDLASIIDVNKYEGFRLGVGLYTSPKLLRWLVVGGHVAYGIDDETVKYGGRADLMLHRNTDLRIRLSYRHDLIESGSTRHMPDEPIGFRDLYRTINLRVFDLVDEVSPMLMIRPTRWLRLRAGANWIRGMGVGGQGFVRSVGDTATSYTLAEAELGIRIMPGEKLYMLDGRSLAQPGKWKIDLTVAKGMAGVLGSDQNYWRITMQATTGYRLRAVGRGGFTLTAGWVDGAVPYLRMFTPRANYDNLSLYSPNSFETVRMNEFLHRWQISLHHAHSFGRWLSPIRWLAPEFVLVNNIGFGMNDQAYKHVGLPLRTMRHGHFESGLVIEDLIRIKIIGIGGGAFMRYGPTAVAGFEENLAFKLSMRIAL